MFDIPNDIPELNTGSDNQPAPSQDSLPFDQGQQKPSMGYDPNLEITYRASGKELREPLETVIKRAQRGYDYAQLVERQKAEDVQRQAEWEAKQRELAQIEQQWKPYHEYASQNPEWAEYVRQQWESRFNTPVQADPYSDETQQSQQSFNLPPQVQRELAEMRQFIAQQKQNEALRVQAEQDQALANEIQSVRKQYTDIDFDYTDPETGESLESKILRHAQEKRIYNFSAAFKDFYFDKLMERNVLQAKENVAKQMQQQNKQGFLASGTESMLTRSNPPNMKRMGYHQLADLAISEMGL